MSAKEILDQTITVREIQKLNLDPRDVLVIKIGVEGMSNDAIASYCKNVSLVFRENLPHTKMIVTTCTFDRPFDLEVVRQEVDEQ